MSTNYYWMCPHCRVSRHIGKTAARFSLRIYPTDETSPIRSLDDWKKLWTSGGEIRDEYGQLTSVEELLKIITRSHLTTYSGRLIENYELCDFEFS